MTKVAMRMSSSESGSGKKYKLPSTTVDAIVTRYRKDVKKHEILLIERLRPPFENHLAFPGGFVDYGEDPKDACIRELEEECTVKGDKDSLKLVTVAGAPDRDPRRHTISIVYAVHVPDQSTVKAADDAKSAMWYDLEARG